MGVIFTNIINGILSVSLFLLKMKKKFNLIMKKEEWLKKGYVDEPVEKGA